MQFTPFPKLPRLSKLATITEKIDGTNAAVVIVAAGQAATKNPDGSTHFGFDNSLATVEGFHIGAQSRTRMLDTSAEGDNFGFAKWVLENAPELIKLGPGTHFGEWWALAFSAATVSACTRTGWLPKSQTGGSRCSTLHVGALTTLTRRAVVRLYRCWRVVR